MLPSGTGGGQGGAAARPCQPAPPSRRLMVLQVTSRIDVMGKPLRVGIIGLGRRRGRRYAPALRALAALFEVAAVGDQIPHQSAAGAARLRRPAAAGPSELLE